MRELSFAETQLRTNVSQWKHTNSRYRALILYMIAFLYRKTRHVHLQDNRVILKQLKRSSRLVSSKNNDLRFHNMEILQLFLLFFFVLTLLFLSC